MLNSLSLHQITDVEITVPTIDHNWVEINLKNSRDEKFELTLFLKEGVEEHANATTLKSTYDFLSELRKSVEKAIGRTLDVQRSQSED